MGKKSVAKGKRGEREAAQLWRIVMPHFGLKHEPRRLPHGQSRRGDDAPDIVGIPGLHIEAKRHKRVNWRAAWKQAFEASEGTGLVPVVQHRDDNAQAMVTLSAFDFADIYCELLKLRGA